VTAVSPDEELRPAALEMAWLVIRVADLD
jgi:hypothetical protein